MKNLLSLIQSAVTRMGAAALLLAPLSAAHATNITQWTFENDAIAVNNGPAPSTGTGTASSIGMNVYPTPNIGITQDDVVQGASGDTGANGVANLTKIWRVRGQAGSNGAANGWSSAAPIGTQGGVFATSTAGFGSITVSFDWYTTTAGEGKLQLQYTTDGSTWNNVAMTLGGTTSGISVKTNTTSSKTVMGSYVQASAQDWFQGLTATISDPAAANNANFAIRMVNASTGTDCVNAAGAALNNTSGNWRFDNVLISGTTFTPTVTYVGNGSTGGTVPVDGNSPYASGATVTVLGNTGALTKTGSSFSSWNTSADGTGTAYAPAAC